MIPILLQIGNSFPVRKESFPVGQEYSFNKIQKYTMRKVIGIGETVLDIIFKNGKPIEAVPGGSSFNAVISLGRAGVNTSFISEAGNDRIGEYVIEF